MDQLRVVDLAHTMGITAKELIFKLRSIGVSVAGEEDTLDLSTVRSIITGETLAGKRIYQIDQGSEGIRLIQNRKSNEQTHSGRIRQNRCRNLKVSGQLNLPLRAQGIRFSANPCDI